MTRNADIAKILGRSEAANASNLALSTGGGGLDSARVLDLIDSDWIQGITTTLGKTIAEAMSAGTGIHRIYGRDGNSPQTKRVYVHATKGMLYASFGSDGLSEAQYPAWQANRILISELSANGFTIAGAGNTADGVTNNLGGYTRPAGSIGFFAAASNVATVTMDTYNGPLNDGDTAMSVLTSVTGSQFSGCTIYINGVNVQTISTSKTEYAKTTSFSSTAGANIVQYREGSGIYHLYDIWVR